MAATTCPHGLSAADCLICKTLQSSQSQVQGDTSAHRDSLRDLIHPKASDPIVRPDAVYPTGAGRGGTRHIGTHLALLVAGLLVIAAVAWIVAGVVFALLHLIELILVAGVAGWAGYRLGLYRGRRRPK